MTEESGMDSQSPVDVLAHPYYWPVFGRLLDTQRAVFGNSPRIHPVRERFWGTRSAANVSSLTGRRLLTDYLLELTRLRGHLRFRDHGGAHHGTRTEDVSSRVS
jgi:hypothetical protein